MTRKVILMAWVAKTDNDFHIYNFSMKKAGQMGPAFFFVGLIVYVAQTGGYYPIKKYELKLGKQDTSYQDIYFA